MAKDNIYIKLAFNYFKILREFIRINVYYRKVYMISINCTLSTFLHVKS